MHRGSGAGTERPRNKRVDLTRADPSISSVEIFIAVSGIRLNATRDLISAGPKSFPRPPDRPHEGREGQIRSGDWAPMKMALLKSFAGYSRACANITRTHNRESTWEYLRNARRVDVLRQLIKLITICWFSIFYLFSIVCSLFLPAPFMLDFLKEYCWKNITNFVSMINSVLSFFKMRLRLIVRHN